MNDDATLLRRYAEEHAESAFTELVRRHFDLVYSAALRRCGGDAHRAADVAQQVFTALARKAPALSHHTVLTAWLYTATRNLALNLLRAEQRRQRHERDAQLMPAFLADSTPDADWAKLRPVLDEVMDQLADADRTAVLLRFFEKRPFAEIGTALHLSEDAARMRVERALEKLHVLLARRGISSTATAVATVLANQAVATAPAGMAANVAGAALASAGAAAGSAMGLLQLMTTTKFLTGAVSVLALVALGTAGYKVHARHEAQAALAIADEERAQLVGRVRELEQRARAEEKNVAELQAAVQAAQAKAIADAEAAKPPPPWNRDEAGKAFQQRHPEVTEVLRDWMDAHLTGAFGDFWRSRGLTAEQIAEFKSLYSMGQARKITDDGKFGQLNGRETPSNAERTRRLKALLGEEGFREHGRIVQERYVGTYPYELARGLCFTETPLTPQQANELLKSMLDVVRRRESPKSRWDAIDRKANELLSPEQQRIWKNVSAAGRAQLELALATQAPRQDSGQK